jgi:hypothetical protein
MASASLATGAAAQHQHKADPGAMPADDSASKMPGEGGESYLTDGGPRDTRVRFYRDIGLMRGHIRVGGELIALGLWDEALPHFLHPTEELYAGMEKYIKGHNIRPFKLELGVLAQTVKAKRKAAYDQALKVVDQRLGGALDKAKEFMHPVTGFTAHSAAEMVKAALGEYESSIENGRFAKPVEYQDSRGFVFEADSMIERAAPQLAKTDAATLSKVRAAMARLKTAWPEPMPPEQPVLDFDAVSALVTEIDTLMSKY